MQQRSPRQLAKRELTARRCINLLDGGIYESYHLDRFRGISQRFLHLRVARYEFLHNHSHLNWRQTFDAALRSIFSIPGDY